MGDENQKLRWNKQKKRFFFGTTINWVECCSKHLSEALIAWRREEEIRGMWMTLSRDSTRWLFTLASAREKYFPGFRCNFLVYSTIKTVSLRQWKKGKLKSLLQQIGRGVKLNFPRRRRLTRCWSSLKLSAATFRPKKNLPSADTTSDRRMMSLVIIHSNHNFHSDFLAHLTLSTPLPNSFGRLKQWENVIYVNLIQSVKFQLFPIAELRLRKLQARRWRH